MAVKRSQAPTQHVPSPRTERNATIAAPPAERPRSYVARGIAAVLAPVLRPAFRKRAPAAAQLLADWPILAGPDLAVRAAPVKFAAGTLTLACTGPVAMELQFSAPALIQRLNLGLGSATVERLRFVRQAPRTALPVPARPHPTEPAKAAPQNLPDGPLGEALAKLYQGVKTRD